MAYDFEISGAKKNIKEVSEYDTFPHEENGAIYLICNDESNKAKYKNELLSH